MYGASTQKLLRGQPVISAAPGDVTTGQISEGPDASALENFVVNRIEAGVAESAYGPSEVLREKVEKRREQIKRITGKDFAEVYADPNIPKAMTDPKVRPSRISKQSHYDVDPTYLDPENPIIDTPFRRMIKQEREIEYLRQQYPEIQSYSELVSETNKLLDFIKSDTASVNRRASAIGTVVGFGGSMQGSFTTNDPFNLATLPFGGVGKTMTRRIFSEAVVQAGIETFNQYLFVKSQKQAFGREFSNQDAALGALFAGAGGAVFRGAFEAAPLAKRYVPEKAKQISNRMVELSKKETRLGRLASKLRNAKDPGEAEKILREAPTKEVNDLIDAVDETPAEQTDFIKAQADREIAIEEGQPKGMEWEEHVARLNEVASAVSRGQPMPHLEPVQGQTLGYDLPALSVKDLEVDAKTFQFKEGGDDFGVTERLKGVTQWNPQMAGTISVFERADGTRFVADGHQRTGLAKRLMANDSELEIKIPAHIYREVDGFSAEDVMVKAAIKNIGEGSGSAMDAAKIFKLSDGDTLAELQRILSPTSALVRHGRDLARLGDDAYSMAVQKVVPEHYAALVGRLVDGDAEQVAIMRIVEKADPDNAFQAEQIIKQAAEDDIDLVETIDLFGGRTEATPLYADKAKVLDRALKQVRKERAALSSLIKNDDIVSEYGNRIDFDSTRAGLDGASWLRYILQSQAYNKGFVSDILTDAAREVREGVTHATAARHLIKAIKEKITTDGAGSLIGDGEGFASAVRQSVSRNIQEERNDLFSQTVDDIAADSTPQKIEAEYQELANPIRAAVASDTGTPSITSPTVKASDGSQLSPSQATTRLDPSSKLSSATIEPDILTGPTSNLSTIVTSKGGHKGTVYHSKNSVKSIIKGLKSINKELDSWLKTIPKDVEGVRYIGSRIKDDVGLASKLEKQGRDPNQISDYLGARFEVDSIAAAREAMEKMGESAHILDIDDFLTYDQVGKRGNYRALHVQFATKDGLSYEVQFIPKELMDIYYTARQFTDKWKNKRGKLTPEERPKMLEDYAESNRIFGEAWAKFKQRTEADDALAAINPDDDLPLGDIVLDADGQAATRLTTMRELVEDIADDDALVDSMRGCLL